MKKFGLLMACSILLASMAHAADKEQVANELRQMFPRLGNVEVSESPVPNVFQFWVGADLNYAYYVDGHILVGDMFDTKNRVSLSENAKKGRIKQLVSDLPSDNMIVYGPEEPKRVINVFTDIDCGYCRKLHAEINTLTDAGVQVRYLAFPRAGVGSNSYNKYVSVWCADDQQVAMTKAKSGQPVEPKKCDNPIAKTHELGRQIGLRGTPMLVYDDGTVVSGYRPAGALIEEFGLKN